MTWTGPTGREVGLLLVTSFGLVAVGAYVLAWTADLVLGRPREAGQYAASRTSRVEDVVIRVGLFVVVAALVAGVVGVR